MPGSIKIDDGSGNYTILTNAGSLGSDKTLTIPNETATLATTTDVNALGTWQDWTPTLTNATQGNGTITARYVQIGKLVVGMFTFTLGSTSAISGDVNITLPVTGATTFVNLASLSFIENGVKDVKGFPILNTTVAYLRAQKASTTYVENATLSSSVPFTWGTGDVISLGFSYEAA